MYKTIEILSNYYFRFEANRLLSLTTATMDCTDKRLWGEGIDPFVRCMEMARDGLYYVGPEDAVRCQFCRLDLSNWSPTDDVHNEHLRNINGEGGICQFHNDPSNLGNVVIGGELMSADLGQDAVPCDADGEHLLSLFHLAFFLNILLLF